MTSSLVAMREGLALPLEDRWRALLDELARRRGFPASDSPAKLGAAVSALSAVYNQGGSPPMEGEMLAARLGFSFPRDVPKAAAAVAELVLAGLLSIPADRPLRVLDLGAGLGASTWGIVRALAASGARGSVDALLVDPEPKALEVARTIASQAGGEGDVQLAVTTRTGTLTSLRVDGPFDVVVLGQMLSEADVTLDERSRAALHAEQIARLFRLVPEGSVVVIEPALRDRTRHLHRVREALLARGARVFAPCLHQATCPFLVREHDWCHEDLEIDLPGWLVPVARAAGLRWERLTFSYLVLRPDGRTLREALSGGGAMRLVSSPSVTKGKRELLLCGDDGALRPAMLLDREAGTDRTEPFETARRGDVISIDPPHQEKARLGRDAAVKRLSLVRADR
jgi:ribosomal protein RSM22 (predicted rRNA methylase)